MKVGFTGTRAGMSARQRLAFLLLLSGLWHRHLESIPRGTGLLHCELHHGDCLGADAQADAIARTLGLRRVLYPGTSEQFRGHSEQLATELCTVRPPAAPLVRNGHIGQAVTLLFAAPAQRAEAARSGTWATVRYAREEGVPVVILDP